MDGNDNSYGDKAPVPTLSRKNWKYWFDEMELVLTSKGVFYTCTETELEYCKRATFTPLDDIRWGINNLNLVEDSSGVSTPASEAVNKDEPQPKAPAKPIPPSIPDKGMFIAVNYEKQEKYRKDAATALRLIRKCIDDFDRELLDDIKTNPKKWTKLRAKYEKITPSEKREKERELVNWVKEQDMSIDDAWVKLTELRREVIRANPDAKIGKDKLFEYLINGLDQEYDDTVNNVDAQPNLDLEEKIDILQRKYLRLMDSRRGSAYTAKAVSRKSKFYSPPRRHPPQRESSSSSGSNPYDSDHPLTCYNCGSERHIKRNCPYINAAREARIKAEGKDRISRSTADRSPRRSSELSPRYSSPHLSSRDTWRRSDTSRSPSRSKSVRFKKKEEKAKVSSKRGKTKTRAYIADETETEADINTGSDSDDAPAEQSRVTQELLSKAVPSKWFADTCASSHMTDQPQLFRGCLTEINPITIKVGGGKLYARHKGTALLSLPNGRSASLRNCLYVPFLGANLVSARRVCETAGLKGAFDDQKMYFHKDKKVILSAKSEQGIYCLNYIAPGPDEAAYNAQEHASVPGNTQEFKMTSEDHDSDDGGPLYSRAQVIEKRRRERYNLYHRRFNHVGPNLLRTLHQVTDLKRPINIPAKIEICDVCAVTKFKKRLRKKLAKHKDKKLALIAVDTAGPFPPSIRGFRWFAEVVDNWSRKVWILLLKNKDDIISALDQLILELERQTGEKLLATRSDNAGEILKVLSTWKVKEGVIPQTTATYTSSQNGAAERAIQNTEEEVRSSLKQAELPVEFWCYAAEAGAYVRNRLARGPRSVKEEDGFKVEVRISPEEAWSGEKPTQSNIKVFGCKAFSHVDPKSHPAGTRSDKYMDTGRECVFVGYNNDTAKQWKVYAPDLQRVVDSSYIQVKEGSPGGNMNLRLRMPLSGLDFAEIGQGTPNTLAERKPRGRPRKGSSVSLPTPAQSSTAEDDERFEIVKKLPDVLKQQKIEVQIPARKADRDTTQTAASSPTPVPNASALNTAQVKPLVPEVLSGVKAGGVTKPNLRRSPRLLKTLKKMVDTHGLYKLDRKSRAVPDKVARAVASSISSSGNESDRQQQATFSPHDSTTPVDTAPTKASRVETPLTVTTRGKRERDPYDAADSDRPTKIHRAMMALLQHIDNYDADEDTEWALLSTVSTDDAIALNIPIPRSYKQAVNDPVYGQIWAGAIEEEINSLLKNHTWEETVAPPGTNIVDTKWVFTVKLNPDGAVERFKARLVGRGFTQQYGVDYTETFAPTVQMATLRAFLSIVAAEDLECHHYDIKNAFTESELKEDIYMAPPLGVTVKKGKVLKILRSLYGLKQSARDWNLLLKSMMLEWGFRQSLADPCLFVHKTMEVMVLVFVDDIAAAARENAHLTWFYEKLSSRFTAKDLGEIEKFLGMRITRDRRSRNLCLDQEQYLDKVLTTFGITNPKHKYVSTPMDGMDAIRPATEDDERVDSNEYSSIIGSLMYAMIYTRPDIAYALGRLSQFMRDPAKHHMRALRRVMRYLRFTIDYRLCFGPYGQTSLIVYSDADYASDRTDRKSISGAAGILGGAAIFWLSRKQNSVSTSTTESEYISMSVTAKQGQWVAQILRDMGYPEYIAPNGITVETRGDNQGALALVKNPRLHERSKHIDVAHHHIRDLQEKNRIRTEYVNTDEMVADGLTKPLAKPRFEKFVRMVGLRSKKARGQ